MKFLCADNMKAEIREAAKEWEIITVEKHAGDKIALKSFAGKYLSAQKNGKLMWNRD